MKYLIIILSLTFGSFITADAQDSNRADSTDDEPLSLIADTPKEGFQVAIQLARKGVTSTQPDKEVLFMLRDVYSKDPDALIASSQVIAIHFQTVAAVNNYWRTDSDENNN